MENLTVENYVKAIYQICSESGDPAASTGDIARRLDLTPGTVTSMLHRLGELGLAEYKTHRGAKLSEAGNRLALRMLRRHRLVELFLVETLGLPWDEIHAEAENLEHAVSDRLIDRIDQYLELPDRDPHGDPIPNADGTLRTEPGEPLSGCAEGAEFVLERVLDQSPEFLRYLSEEGLEVGANARVEENNASAGVITIRSADRPISLSRQVAEQLLIRRV